MKKTKLFIVVATILLCLRVSAQSVDNPVMEKREGAEIGAKPCRYDNNKRPSVLVTAERLSLVRNEVLQNGSARGAVYHEYVKSNADYWLNRKIEVTGTGGWLHVFFWAAGSDGVIP